MKILLIVVTVVLAATAACSGYFIFDLNMQINDLETELAKSSGDLENKIESTGSRLDLADEDLGEEIRAAGEELTAAIEDTNASLNDYTITADTRFQGIEGDIAGNSGQISVLKDQGAQINDFVTTAVLGTQQLYENTIPSLVTISDGTDLWGSGFIIESAVDNGSLPVHRVITAYHVVKNLDDIYVTFNDGRSSRAYIQAGSESTDVAILNLMADIGNEHLDVTKMPALKLADSNALNIGEPVYVVGSPDSYEAGRLGFRGTVTTGVISQVRRCVTASGVLHPNLLQIDAAVNYGNSGGPLLNKKGEVIGIVIIRLDPRLGDGISFAVPCSLIKKVETVIEAVSSDDPIVLPVSGPLYEYQSPYSGVTVIDIPPQDITGNDNTVTSGAKVIAVAHPASTAGVKSSDIITMLDDREVTNADEFYSFLEEYYAVGDEVILEIMRDGEPVSVTLTLKEKP